MTIKNVLKIIMIVCSMCPMILITGVSLKFFSDQITNMARSNIESVARINSNNIEAFFDEQIGELKSLVNIAIVKNMIDCYKQGGETDQMFLHYREQMEEILKDRVRGRANIIRTSIITSNKEILATDDPRVYEGIAFSIPDEIFDELGTEVLVSGVLSNPLINNGKEYTATIVPIIYEGDIPCYILQLLDNSYFETIVQAAKFYKSGGILIINGENEIIASSGTNPFEAKDEATIIEFNGQKRLDLNWQESRFTDRLRMHEQSMFVYVMEDVRMIACGDRVAEPAWVVVSHMDESELTNMLTRTFYAIILATGFLLLVVLLMYREAFQFFMVPTSKLLHAIEGLQKGDEEMQFDYKANNEFGQLAEAFNSLAEANRLSKESLRKESRKYRRAISATSEAIYEINLTKDILQVTGVKNGYEMDIHTQTFSGSVEFVAQRYVLPEYRRMFMETLSNENLKRLFELERQEELTVEYKRHDRGKQKELWLHNTIVRVSDFADNDIYLLMYIKDIHEVNLKKELEKAREIEHAKNMFLANVSHEIRTPINAITGMTHFLKRTQLSDKQSDFVYKIETASDVLIGIVNDILDLSKMMSDHKLSLNPTPFRFEDVLQMASDMFSGKAKEKNLEFTVTSGLNPDLIVVSDKLRISQIMMNLISNAIKFTDSGKVAVHISIVEDNMDEVTLRICVEDTGVGIAHEDQGRIWQEFLQSEGTLTKNYQGTGLGLAIVRRIVEQLNGSIALESEPGEGTQFCVTLTLARGSGDDLAYERNSEERVSDIKAQMEETWKGRKILLVEDNEINSEIAQMIIQDIGFVCECAFDGVQAVEMLEEKGIDYYSMVLTDIHMPKMDGYTLSEKMKDIGVAVPVIAFTATTVDDETRTRYAGVIHDYLAKPIKPEEIVSMIIRYMK